MIGLLMLAATVSAAPNIPIALGPWASVEAAGRQAQACGMKDLRFDPLEDRRAMLLMGGTDSYATASCALAWIKRHRREMKFERLPR